MELLGPAAAIDLSVARPLPSKGGCRARHRAPPDYNPSPNRAKWATLRVCDAAAAASLGTGNGRGRTTGPLNSLTARHEKKGWKARRGYRPEAETVITRLFFLFLRCQRAHLIPKELTRPTCDVAIQGLTL